MLHHMLDFPSSLQQQLIHSPKVVRRSFFAPLSAFSHIHTNTLSRLQFRRMIRVPLGPHFLLAAAPPQRPSSRVPSACVFLSSAFYGYYRMHYSDYCVSLLPLLLSFFSPSHIWIWDRLTSSPGSRLSANRGSALTMAPIMTMMTEIGRICR